MVGEMWFFKATHYIPSGASWQKQYIYGTKQTVHCYLICTKEDIKIHIDILMPVKSDSDVSSVLKFQMK